MSKKPKKQPGYVYDNYDEHYYRYEAKKIELRNQYPTKMERKDWVEYYSKLMDIIHSSEDWFNWIQANPVPFFDIKPIHRRKVGSSIQIRKTKEGKTNYPTFILLLNGVVVEGKEWNNLKEAEEELGLSKGAACALLRGHRKRTEKGYSLKYKDEYENKA